MGIHLLIVFTIMTMVVGTYGIIDSIVQDVFVKNVTLYNLIRAWFFFWTRPNSQNKTRSKHVLQARLCDGVPFVLLHRDAYGEPFECHAYVRSNVTCSAASDEILEG